MPLRSLIKRSLRPFLWTANQTGYLAKSDYAQLLSGIFKKHQVQIAFDVGANIGRYRGFLRDEVNYAHWIISFEPIPNLATQLKTAATKDPHWIVRDVALGSEVGNRTINIMERSVFSSFLQPNHSVISDFSEWNRPKTSVQVSLNRLENEWQTLAPKLPDSPIFLKCDTQGFDLEVLRGSERLFSKIAAIQVELSFIPIYQGCPDFIQMINYLAGHSFAVAGMLPVVRDNLGRLIELDCLFINQSL